MENENEFKIWFDTQTIGFSRGKRKRFKDEFAEKTGISPYVVDNWLWGTTKPNDLQKFGVNAILNTMVFSK